MKHYYGNNRKCTFGHFLAFVVKVQEEFEDAKGIIRIRK